jgi:thioredoxin reductase
MSEHDVVDVVVVGGGPAGLAAALWLGRNRLRVLVADRGEPRNRWVDATFGYLGFDGAHPDALLDAARKDLVRYDVAVVGAGVRSVHRVEGSFSVDLDDRRVTCASIVFATGVADVVPPVPGLAEHYGTGVFVCPLCDGYEVRDRSVVVLGAGGAVGGFATEVQRWAGTITVVPLGDESPSDDIPDDVELATAPAASVAGSSSVEGVVLADGSTVPCDAIFLRSATVPVTDLAAHLGCDLDDDGLIVVDPDGATSVDGVFAAGDCTPGPQIVQVAAAEGARAGLRCAQALVDRT